MSDRIRVLSIIGRFLEHSRVWHFGNGGADEFYIGSADWMPRNFLRRVEAVAPVEAPRLQARLRSLLRTCLEDNRQAWELDAAGTGCSACPEGEVRSTHVGVGALVGRMPGVGRPSSPALRCGERRLSVTSDTS